MLRDLVGSIVWRHACLTYVRATTTTTTTSNLAEHLESFGKKKHCFCSAVWHAYSVVLGPSKVLRGIVEAQPLLPSKEGPRSSPSEV